MDVSPYVERVREELSAASAGGSPEVREAAERMGRALDAALRLAFFDLAADAAAEVTASLPQGRVTARLTGRGVDFVVEGATPLPLGPTAPLSSADGPIQDGDEGDLERITVRIPEGIKELAEQRAGQFGQSLNSWIVKTLRQATGPGGVDIEVTPNPFVSDFPHAGPGRGRMSGWI